MENTNKHKIKNKLRHIINIVLDINKIVEKEKNKHHSYKDENINNQRPAGISYVYNNSHKYFINSLRN